MSNWSDHLAPLRAYSAATGLYQIIHAGRSCSTEARFHSPDLLIPRRSGRPCLIAIAGVICGEARFYDYLHYHSRIHEVLGIARGSATVRIGGNKGQTLKVKAGDALIIPAGTGHQSLKASPTFMAVGAYPPRGTYDECAPLKEDYAKARKTVARVPRPRTDPVFGAHGALLKLWERGAR